MTPKQSSYYRWAGYWSLPCVAFHFVLEAVGIFYFTLAFVFGSAGLLFAISGIWRGRLGAKICSVFSLFFFDVGFPIPVLVMEVLSANRPNPAASGKGGIPLLFHVGRA